MHEHTTTLSLVSLRIGHRNTCGVHSTKLSLHNMRKNW